MSFRPTRSRLARAIRSASAWLRFSTVVWATVQLASTDRCGNRLNCWNTMPMLLPGGVQVAVRVGDVLTADEHLALLRLLQQVDAAQQGGLARAGRADDADDLALARR